jgi:hypothetical protein
MLIGPKAGCANLEPGERIKKSGKNFPDPSAWEHNFTDHNRVQIP